MEMVAIVFPGQGSQYIGMGKEFYNEYPEYKNIFDIAEDILKFNIKKIIFEDDESKLSKTNITQPAIFLINTLCYKVLLSHILHLTSHLSLSFAGHSLGEYSGLYASCVLNLEDTLFLVSKRGEIMQKVSEKNSGGMLAVIGPKENEIEEVRKTIKEGIVEIANLNTPKQIIVSGDILGLSKFEENIKLLNPQKVIKLNVSGPFHSSLMKKSADEFKNYLECVKFNEPKFPLVSNLTGEFIKKNDNISELLYKQIFNKVRWYESINTLISSGVNTFIEVGPKKVLSGLIKNISQEVSILNVEDSLSLKQTINFLERLICQE